MSGTLVKEGIAPHFSDETLHRACEAQAGANLARNVNDFSMYQIVMPCRKRKYQADEEVERIEVSYATKKARLEEYHAHKMSQLKEEAIKEKERHKKHLVATLQKRKREVQKLITTKFQVVDCENREGKWFVKLKRKVEYSMSPEKIREVLNQPLVIPKLPPERKHHARTRPNSRSRKRAFTKVNGWRANVQTFQWGLTQAEIRQDLKQLNIYDSGMEIEHTSGFLNNATVTRRPRKYANEPKPRTRWFGRGSNDQLQL